MPAFKSLTEADARKAISALVSAYKNAHYYLNFDTDIDLLVAAIISAQTRDEVVNSVTPSLFKRYKTVKDYAGAKEEDIAEIIRKVSFAGNKSKNIVKACKKIEGDFGGSIPRTMEGLTSLPGVGRKTANTVLINAYGIVEGIPVDTWVIKLSKRIGLSSSDDPEEMESDLSKIVDRKYWKTFAYVLKNHGKAVCQSQVPICSKCIIKEICPKNGVSKHA